MTLRNRTKDCRTSRLSLSPAIRLLTLTVPTTVSLLTTACGIDAPASRTTPSALDIQGEGARIIADEWWFQFWLGTIIFLGVIGLLGTIIYKQRRNTLDLGVDMDKEGDMKWIWIGGIALPIVVLSAVFAFSLRSSIALASPPQEEVATIEVIGHRWWWEVRYPEEGIVTANQIHVPVGQSVRVNVSSADVIHSFWVPQVDRKIDLIPGRSNSTWLQADVPGVYRGICAEFCGLQHARMNFMLVAESPERYQQWVEHERQPAAAPENELAQLGQQVFLRSSCVYCHTIRGTPAAGQVGPDLTHLANRMTIAAGTLENTPGNLLGWIIDPQHIKPGSLMPPTDLTGEELQALLAYLGTLR